MNTYIGSAKYEYVDGLRSSTTTSNFSSALYTLSLIDSESRFLSFIFTTEALRPDLLNSAFCTTIGSAPSMITLPARSSCAIFISVVLHGLICLKLSILTKFRKTAQGYLRDRRLRPVVPPNAGHAPATQACAPRSLARPIRPRPRRLRSRPATIL